MASPPQGFDTSGLDQQQGMQGQMGGGAAALQGAPQGTPGQTPQGGPGAGDMQPQPGQGTFGADQETDPQEQMENYIDYAFSQANLAKKLRKKKTKDGALLLQKMGTELVQGYDEDEQSRHEWKRQTETALKLALLTREVKTYPWPKASNIKYPLLATAAMQFTARAYPALVPADGNIVKTKIVQKDPQDPIYQAAERVSQHMSFQVLNRIPNWEEDMDKLLMTMAIVGICFKKTYYNSVTKCNHSHLVFPENLCINYHAKNLESAYRKTELLYYTDNDIQEKINNDEEFLDLKFEREMLSSEDEKKKQVTAMGNPPPTGKHTPHVFLGVHTFWDLDEDGYEEPYIVTIHKASKQVVRIIARWDQDGVHRDEDGKIVQIEPIEYFTDFPFIPNPDGSIYALGFGLLLGPLNEAVDTGINQLVDAGTINNLQGGFIGKGLRLKMGQTSMQPGEWKVVNATGEDLQKSVFALPTKEPSGILLSLVQMLIQSGKELASIAEIFVGKMPGQNTPATTTQETIKQGMAVFTAIYKRVYRSLGKEFRKLYRLNKICPDTVEEEAMVAGVELQQSDYDLPEWTIIPAADPTGDTATMRQAKMQQVGQLLQMGTIDPMVYTRAVLDANEIPNAQSFIKQPEPPPPDPKQQTEQAKQQTMQLKSQLDQQKGQQDMQLKQQKADLEQQVMQAKIQFEQQKAIMEAAGKAQEARHTAMMQAIDQHGQRMQVLADAFKQAQGLMHEGQKHQQTLTLTAQRERQKQRLAEESQQAQIAQQDNSPTE